MRKDGVASLPGFAESLRLLVESERYSLSDIGMMFGVSRERVRQLCERLGIDTPKNVAVGLFQYREWNDSLHRFVPRPRSEVSLEAHRRRVANRREAVRNRIARRRDDIIAAVARLRNQLGRDPFWREILETIDPERRRKCSGYSYAAIVLGVWSHERNTKKVLADFRRATGLGPLPRGHHAHAVNRSAPRATKRGR